MVDMSIGERLMELRKAAGLTQAAMGAIAGTTKQYVSQLENGTNQVPNGLMMEAWARHFGVTQQWLATGTGARFTVSEPTGDYRIGRGTELLAPREAGRPARPARDAFAQSIPAAAFTSRLQRGMASAGFDAASLASEAGVDPASVQYLVSGSPDLEKLSAITLFKVAHAIDMTGYELLTGESEVQRDTTVAQSQSVQLDHWRMAFQLVADFLDGEDLMLPPSKHAEVTLLVHDLLLEGLPRAKVLQFVRAAAA